MFALTLAYNIWCMGLSLWGDVSLTFMNPNWTLTFDLMVKFLRFMIWLSVWATDFLSFHIVILCECITMVQCVVYIHELCMTLTSISNYIFTMNLRLARLSMPFDIGIQNFDIQYITMKQHVAYILVLSLSLSFDQIVVGRAGRGVEDYP